MNETSVYVIDNEGFVKVLNRDNRIRPIGGAESCFLPIDKKVGLKGFQNKEDAVYAMQNQLRAYRLGFAPKVVSEEIYEVIMPVGGTYLSSKSGWHNIRNRPKYKNKHRKLYAYKTQIVTKTFKPFSLLSGINKERMENLGKKMMKAGYLIEDLHGGNVGLIKDKMVFLDFGPLSLGEKQYE
jgi:hypothetical protein